MTRQRLQLLALLFATLLGLALPPPAASSGLRGPPQPLPTQLSPARGAGGGALARRRAPDLVPAIGRGRDAFSPLRASRAAGAGGKSIAAIAGATPAWEWGRASSRFPAASVAPPVLSARPAAGPSSPRAPPAVSR